MGYEYKPGYLRFFKHQMSFKKKRFIEDQNKNIYIEDKKTESTAKFSYWLIIIVMIIADTFQWFSVFGNKLKLLLGFLVLIVLYLIFETAHWFYAKFHLIEKNKNEDTNQGDSSYLHDS
jgi:hypothetical protein